MTSLGHARACISLIVIRPRHQVRFSNVPHNPLAVSRDMVYIISAHRLCTRNGSEEEVGKDEYGEYETGTDFKRDTGCCGAGDSSLRLGASDIGRGTATLSQTSNGWTLRLGELSLETVNLLEGNVELVRVRRGSRERPFKRNVGRSDSGHVVGCERRQLLLRMLADTARGGSGRRRGWRLRSRKGSSACSAYSCTDDRGRGNVVFAISIEVLGNRGRLGGRVYGLESVWYTFTGSMA